VATWDPTSRTRAMRIAAIVPAAGQGSRFSGDVKKQFVPLNGLPILSHTVRALAAPGAISTMVVVVPPGDEERGREALRLAAVDVETEVVPGGRERQDSVFRGLQRAKPDTDLVVIHDGVRPFVLPELILAVIEAAKEAAGAIAALPATDTIKRVDACGVVVGTPERGALWAAQTPQAFRYTLLMAAYREAQERGIVATDDAALVERIGGTVRVVRGSPENIKITSADDILLAELILRRRAAG